MTKMNSSPLKLLLRYHNKYNDRGSPENNIQKLNIIYLETLFYVYFCLYVQPFSNGVHIPVPRLKFLYQLWVLIFKKKNI